MMRQKRILSFTLAVGMGLMPISPVGIPEARAVTGVDDAVVLGVTAAAIGTWATVTTAVVAISYMQKGMPADRATAAAFRDVSSRTMDLLGAAGVQARKIQQGLALVTAVAVMDSVQRIQGRLSGAQERLGELSASMETATAVATANLQLAQLYARYGLTAEIEANRRLKNAWIRRVIVNPDFGTALSSTLSQLAFALQFSQGGRLIDPNQVQAIMQAFRDCRAVDPQRFTQLLVGSLAAVVLGADVVVAFLDSQFKTKARTGPLSVGQILPRIAFVAIFTIGYVAPFLDCVSGKASLADQMRSAGPDSPEAPHSLALASAFLVTSGILFFADTYRLIFGIRKP